ncbi:hypothetical protein RFI_39958 [Reticulomyxa filosa]|uniref:Uncharacterized protein n=1 Tax=Reticulomyxa filosa TaxID=46433 RepID=X6L847_RETFI|nr:hypothetical protein RFI_39958 [Reticulomyxa filosa]|eukprot:ETN97568.1 hypothetical protein RFI_39958 [Reticulomyxa filosa]
MIENSNKRLAVELLGQCWSLLKVAKQFCEVMNVCVNGSYVHHKNIKNWQLEHNVWSCFVVLRHQDNATSHTEITAKEDVNKTLPKYEFHFKFFRPEANRKYVVDSENKNIQNGSFGSKEEFMKQFELECKNDKRICANLTKSMTEKMQAVSNAKIKKNSSQKQKYFHNVQTLKKTLNFAKKIF